MKGNAVNQPNTIWKRDTDTDVRGPSSHLADLGFHMSAEWSEVDGLQFWGNLERGSETYTLAEVKKIHSAIGRLLAKVEAEPRPTRR